MNRQPASIVERTRQRAPALAPEERRQMIVEAALPLVLEHGIAVTTSQIARAAGVAEGTLFRAFGDKGELIAACAQAALRPDAEIERIRAQPADLPVRDRLLEIARSASEHLGRMARLAQALRSWDDKPPPLPRLMGEQEDIDAGRPGRGMTQLVQALEAGLVADAAELRLPPDETARTFLTLLFVNQAQRNLWGGTPLDPAILTDLFLDGALADTATARERGGRDE